MYININDCILLDPLDIFWRFMKELSGHALFKHIYLTLFNYIQLYFFKQHLRTPCVADKHPQTSHISRIPTAIISREKRFVDLKQTRSTNPQADELFNLGIDALPRAAAAADRWGLRAARQRHPQLVKHRLPQVGALKARTKVLESGRTRTRSIIIATCNYWT